MQSEELPPWGSAIAGATGAVLANALVYPLDIVKTRLQVQYDKPVTEKENPNDIAKPIDHHSELNHNHHHHYSSTLDAIRKISTHDGIAGLYAGMPGSLVGVASTNFAYFYWYTVVRDVYLSSLKPATAAARPLGTVAELSLGALAGALAQLFTIPVAVVTTRQQTQPRGHRKSLISTGRDVVNSEDGVTGLWRGLKASLVLVANPAITYAAYQRFRELLFPGKANLQPREAFLLGALSKSLATILTQPLIVAKVGLQSHPPPVRKGKPFSTFSEVMSHIVEYEGILALFKGIGPQLLKGLLVQGLLMMTKERMELVFLLLFRYVRRLRGGQLRPAAASAAASAASAGVRKSAHLASSLRK